MSEVFPEIWLFKGSRIKASYRNHQERSALSTGAVRLPVVWWNTEPIPLDNKELPKAGLLSHHGVNKVPPDELVLQKGWTKGQ